MSAVVSTSGEEITAVDPHAALHGAMLGPWRLLEQRGSGTFGVVFRAVLAAEPGTIAAVKVAREPADPRFEREAELLARCRSPHLPKLLDKGVWRSPQGFTYPYVVMQWVQGVPLYEWAKLRGLSNAQAVRALSHVARALAEVHVRGGLHRDVKGDNVLVDGDGFAVLVDAGVAITEGAPPVTEHGHLPPGTTQYRSPEAHRFRRLGGKRYEATPADDVYALGVTAYRLLTGTYPPPGTLPFSGDEVRRLVRPGELATVCPELEGLILRWLSPKPEQRGSALEAARALEALLRSGGAHLAGPVEAVSMEPTEPSTGAPESRHRQVPPWLSWAGSSALGALSAFGLVFSLWALLAGLREPASPPEVVRWEEQDAGTPDAGLADAGVAEVALAAVHREPVVRFGVQSVAKEMPKTPFPGQRKPPCETPEETEVLGACWMRLYGMKPPCGKKTYDYDDGCYVPSFNAPRQPTSGGTP